MKTLFALFAPAALLALPAAAQNDIAAPAAAPVKAKKPVKICRVPETTGSRMGGKVCRTGEEWAALERAGCAGVSTNARGSARTTCDQR